jgi:hypothetical protein
LNEDIHKAMMESYYDGGVSVPQRMELGNKRPEITEFIRFSLKYEGVPFRSLWTFGGLEFAYSYEEDFKKIGVSGDVLAGCLDADPEAIRFVCRAILRSIAEAKTLTKGGKTQLASRGLTVNPTAVKAFILATLDAKERYQIDEIVPDLYFLLSQVLFPGEPEVDALEASKNLKFNSAYVAWAYRHKHKTYPSYRLLAKLFKVAPSTISRLFESRVEFEKMVDTNNTFGADPSTVEALKDIYPSL